MKKNIVLRIAAVLLCLTLFSTHRVSRMLARYTAMGSGYDSAQVAKFGRLTLTESENTYTVIPGTGITKDPKITMTPSEVAVRIFVDITVPDGWSWSGAALVYTMNNVDWFTVTPADGWVYDSASGSTFTFRRDLPANATLTDAPIFKDDTVAVSHEIPYNEYYTTPALRLTVTARAEQID